jgi:mRNA interferase MazF
VVTREYVPDCGDLVWLDFSPQTGREQVGRRPALILSPRIYNEKAGLAVACPVTNHAKGYPFEVELRSSPKLKGVILADHVKSLDWRQRAAQRIGRISPVQLEEVRDCLRALLGLP